VSDSNRFIALDEIRSSVREAIIRDGHTTIIAIESVERFGD
jgi:hypothetical protein